MIRHLYEFSCTDCGHDYLRETNELTKCPNLSCKDNYMQLYAMVETIESEPYMGLKFFRSRKLLTNK